MQYENPSMLPRLAGTMKKRSRYGRRMGLGHRTSLNAEVKRRRRENVKLWPSERFSS